MLVKVSYGYLSFHPRQVTASGQPSLRFSHADAPSLEGPPDPLPCSGSTTIQCVGQFQKMWFQVMVKGGFDTLSDESIREDPDYESTRTRLVLALC